MGKRRDLESIAKDIKDTQLKRVAYRGRVHSLIEQMETARSCYVEQGNRLDQYLDEFSATRDEQDLAVGLPAQGEEATRPTQIQEGCVCYSLRPGLTCPLHPPSCTCHRPATAGTTRAEHCPVHSPHV